MTSFFNKLSLIFKQQQILHGHLLVQVQLCFANWTAVLILPQNVLVHLFLDAQGLLHEGMGKLLLFLDTRVVDLEKISEHRVDRGLLLRYVLWENRLQDFFDVRFVVEKGQTGAETRVVGLRLKQLRVL